MIESDEMQEIYAAIRGRDKQRTPLWQYLAAIPFGLIAGALIVYGIDWVRAL